MDGLSGGPFGVHLTVYLWMYVGVRWAIQFLHVGNVCCCRFAGYRRRRFRESGDGFCCGGTGVSAPWPVESMFPVVSRQVLWGAVTGPFLILFFIRGTTCNRARKSFFAEKDPEDPLTEYLNNVDSDWFSQAAEHISMTVVIAAFVVIDRPAAVSAGDRRQELRRLSEINSIRLKSVDAPRGLIYDTHGRLMVDNRPSYDLSIIVKDAKPLERTIGKAVRIHRHRRKPAVGSPGKSQGHPGLQAGFARAGHRPRCPGSHRGQPLGSARYLVVSRPGEIIF
jgi:hypothetical protein